MAGKAPGPRRTRSTASQSGRCGTPSIAYVLTRKCMLKTVAPARCCIAAALSPEGIAHAGFRLPSAVSTANKDLPFRARFRY